MRMSKPLSRWDKNRSGLRAEKLARLMVGANTRYSLCGAEGLMLEFCAQNVF